MAAIIAFVVGVLPNVPGFLAQIGVLSNIPAIFSTLYGYAWFVGLPLAGACYYVLMKMVVLPRTEQLALESL